MHVPVTVDRRQFKIGTPRHGHTGKVNGKVWISPTYSSWCSMKGRCRYSCVRSFEHYGGRGIKVCDRWQVFDNFLEDMGERPEGKTLDRIDPNGDYQPGNVRWATAQEQRGNRREAQRRIGQDTRLE